MAGDVLQKSTTTQLSGWEGIENHVMKHDTAGMKDYADDIDTLLAFLSLLTIELVSH